MSVLVEAAALFTSLTHLPAEFGTKLFCQQSLVPVSWVLVITAGTPCPGGTDVHPTPGMKGSPARVTQGEFGGSQLVVSALGKALMSTQ